MANWKTNLILILTLQFIGLLLTHAAFSAPVALNDRAMDMVQAGNATDAGGVIIGNSSTAVLSQRTGLRLKGEAQQEAKGLNIINGNESAVANTVNIWDGSLVIAGQQNSGTNSTAEVNQSNRITQTQSRSATLSGYLRSEADETATLHHSASDNYISKVVNSNDTTALFEETRISSTISSAKVDTGLKFNVGDKFYFEGNLGQGIAGAGHTEVAIDGGSADIALAIGGGITAEADSADITGGINVAGLDFGDTGFAAGIKAEAEVSLLVEVDLPELEITIDGAGCGVATGSCNASSMSSEYTDTKTDNSTLDIVENYQSGQSAFAVVETNSYRSPFELESADAEYIVIDNASLELDSEIVLELSESAQKEIEGMNIVNAVGSNIANGTNISRTASFDNCKTKLVLNQFNIVHHGN